MGESKTPVHLSTCGPPLREAPFSLCCFLENLPTSASVFFSRQTKTGTFDVMARITTSCSLLKADVGFAAGPCQFDGLVRNFSIVTMQNDDALVFERSGNLLNQHAGETWKCGFYGNSSTFKIHTEEMLDAHLGFANGRPGESVHLTWPMVTSSSGVNILAPNGTTLVHIDQTNNATVLNSNRVSYLGIVNSAVTIEIPDAQDADNGTYVLSTSKTRIGRTLVIRHSPEVPVIKFNNDWKNASNILTGSLACLSKSLSVAPPFFGASLAYTWFIPDPADDAGYQASPSNQTLLVSGLDCNQRTQLPVYCIVTEGDLTSESDAAYVSNKCGNTFQEDFRKQGFVIAMIVLAVLLIFTIVISLVLGRQRIRKCWKRTAKRCGKCCSAYCAGSSSDTDSDLEGFLGGERAGHRLGGGRRRREILDLVGNNNGDSGTGLEDGLGRTSERLDFQQQLQIALEESRQASENLPPDLPPRPNQATDGDQVAGNSNDGHGSLPSLSPEMVQIPPLLDSDDEDEDGLSGAVGSGSGNKDDRAVLKEVETLLTNHHRHLRSEVVTLEISRDNIVENVLAYYSDENVALSRITVKMLDESGLDCGGVTSDMFTTFWDQVRERYFQGCEAVVPFLHAHRFSEDITFRTLGRILSHTLAVTREFPLPMCKAAIIGMIYDTTEVAEETIIEDFMYFLDEVDRKLVMDALKDVDSLSPEQTDEVRSIFERFDYAVVSLKPETFKYHLTLLARNVVCIRPRPLLEMMRSGLPEAHFTHFWSRFHLHTLDVMFRALEPTPDRVVARLDTEKSHDDLSRNERKVFNYLKDFVKEMPQMELLEFLHFVTGSKSTPRSRIIIDFTHESGLKRIPMAHTCSNMIVLPDTYKDYDTFRSEFKHVLASEEAYTMNMA
ncbi:hypothetical protein MAR_020696 [Mya arenaria]|uniref:HECT domain-containing protein n=1 Tax=Mya arenaria TaxID=6604 RepID=A0ABY7E8P5_MYAAR|nr:hypothetical protein MAR_020696 [Mya arenaria]